MVHEFFSSGKRDGQNCEYSESVMQSKAKQSKTKQSKTKQSKTNKLAHRSRRKSR
jgi:hypothetical protein